jgi:hypothetical protein
LIKDIEAVSAHECPDENGDPRYRHNDRLDHKQPSKIVRVHVQERDLRQPEKEERDHGVGRDALAFWNTVMER